MSTTPVPDDELSPQICAELAAALAPRADVEAVRERLRARVLRSVRQTPPPAGTSTWRVADEGWFQPGPFVTMKLLRRDAQAGMQELLVRLEPGVCVPAHTHGKEEQMVILSGELHLGEHLLRAGDVHVAPPGSAHPPITTEHGVLLLLRIEDPMPA